MTGQVVISTLAEMTQEKLIRSIEQQLDNLSYLDEDMFYQYCCDYYDDDDEPIVELFTPGLLEELEELVNELDT